jgi:hypothetical protein
MVYSNVADIAISCSPTVIATVRKINSVMRPSHNPQMQIAEIHAEAPEAALPWRVEVPGYVGSISVHRLVTFTSTRFLNAFTQGPVSTGTKPKNGSRAEGDSSPSASVASFEQEGSAMQHLFAIMAGSAPQQLSADEILRLVEAAKPCLADAIILRLPVYIAQALHTDATQPMQARSSF